MSFEAQENKTKKTNSQNLYEKKYKFNILGITFGFRDGTSVKAFAPYEINPGTVTVLGSWNLNQETNS